ncbi:MAG TPA: hypothetical protein VME46_19750 [Acidimicrobiales bacterium]|nr:hypothetical protein [Acidimicrobiales bacterium]
MPGLGCGGGGGVVVVVVPGFAVVVVVAGPASVVAVTRPVPNCVVVVGAVLGALPIAVPVGGGVVGAGTVANGLTGPNGLTGRVATAQAEPAPRHDNATTSTKAGPPARPIKALTSKLRATKRSPNTSTAHHGLSRPPPARAVAPCGAAAYVAASFYLIGTKSAVQKP